MIFKIAELAQALFKLVEKQKSVPEVTTPAASGPGLVSTLVTTVSPPIIDPKILELHRAEEHIGKAGKETFQSLSFVFICLAQCFFELSEKAGFPIIILETILCRYHI